MIINSDEIFNILGLSEPEKRVIQATSKMARSASSISRAAKVPRSTLPYMLAKLERRHLLTSMGTGRKKVTWKSDMRRVQRCFYSEYLKGNSKRSDVANENPPITVHHGHDGILEIFEAMIQMPKNSRVIALQPDNSIRHALQHVPVEEWVEIDEAIKRRKYIVEGLVHEKSVQTVIDVVGKANAQKIFDSYIGRLEDYVKIPEEFANVDAEIYVFGGSAYLIDWVEEIAIGIHDKNMLALLLAMLSCVKELVGTRYSQNEKMRKRLAPPYSPR